MYQKKVHPTVKTCTPDAECTLYLKCYDKRLYDYVVFLNLFRYPGVCITHTLVDTMENVTWFYHIDSQTSLCLMF